MFLDKAKTQDVRPGDVIWKRDTRGVSMRSTSETRARAYVVIAVRRLRQNDWSDGSPWYAFYLLSSEGVQEASFKHNDLLPIVARAQHAVEHKRSGHLHKKV